MYGECREKPTLDAIVAKHGFIADIIFIGLLVAVDDNARHIENGVAMAIERGTLQRVAVGHLVILPLLVQFFKGLLSVGPKRIDDPDVLLKYLSWFHDAKVQNSTFIPSCLPNFFHEDEAERYYAVTLLHYFFW